MMKISQNNLKFLINKIARLDSKTKKVLSGKDVLTQESLSAPLAADVFEHSTARAGVTVPVKKVELAPTKNILKENLEKYENVTIDDILNKLKKSDAFDTDEIDNIECAVSTIADDSKEFKAMLDSLISRKKAQMNIMSQDETSVSETIWSLMSIEDAVGSKMKNVSSLIANFAKNGADLKDINAFIDNLGSSGNKYILNEIDRLEPVMQKLAGKIDIASEEFLSCSHCILKNNPQFAAFFYKNPTFLKAYNAIGLKLPDEDIRLMIKNYSQKISDEEKYAMSLYKSESQKINVGEMPNESKIIENYLNKQQIKENATVYRGEDYGFVDCVKIGDETLGDILRANEKSSPNELKKLIAYKLSDYQIIQGRFMSTSFDPNIVESGKFGSKIVWNLTLPKGTKCSCIDMVLPDNAMSGEAEVLVQKNSQLFIKNLQFENNKWYIDAVVIQ